MKPEKRSHFEWIGPPLVLGLILLILPLRTAQQWENFTVDFRFRTRAQSDPDADPRILIVGIDEWSLENLGRWPWARDIHGQFLQILSLRPPDVIAFDLFFSEPSQNTAEDDAFADSLATHPNAIVGAVYEHGLKEAETRLNSETGTVLAADQFFDGQSIGKTEAIENITGDRSGIPGANAGLLPVPVIRQSSFTGFVNVDPSAIDGIRRKLPLVVRCGFHVFPSLVLQAVLRSHGLKSDAVAVRLGDSVTIQKKDGTPIVIPIDAGGHMTVNYRNQNGFKAGSYFGLMQQLFKEMEGTEPWPAEFPPVKGQMLLVGGTAQGVQDLGPTPLQTEAPLVMVHANALNNILRGDFLTTIPAWPLWLGWLLLGWATLVFLRSAPVWLAIGLPVLLVAAFGGIGWLLFVEKSILIPLFWPSFGFVALHGGSGVNRLIKEMRAKGRIKAIFGTYVSPEVVEKMVESGEDPKLGGEEAEITAFFSDIQSFSAFSEILPPTELVNLMIEYLSELTGILHFHGGTLDKYIGDAIVGMFGAPLPFQDHACRACLSAIEMQRRQAELREKWKTEGRWPALVHQMRTRIGLNTGLAVIGNIGSHKRFNYTMMGDNVNLAARCESGAREYGVYIMVAEETRRHAEASHPGEIVFRYLDKIVVKGRTRPVEMFEVMGRAGELSGGTASCLETYDRAMKKYLARDWTGAKIAFESAAREEPHRPETTPGSSTSPSLVMVARCAAMAANPPGEDWDGVFMMTTK